MASSSLLLLVTAFAIQSATVTASFTWNVMSSYTHFAKRMSPNIFTGGRLTEREVEYVAAAGFKTLLSLAQFNSHDEEFHGMSGSFPSSEEEVAIAKSVGMVAHVYQVDMSPKSVQYISTLIHNSPKPVFIHCNSGWTASLYAELHMFLSGMADSADIYSNTLTLGWDFQSNSEAVSLISAVTGIKVDVTDPVLEQTLTDGEDSYKAYYWTHRLANDYWYNLGQPLDTHVNAIQSAGYKSVISFRSNGEATNRLPTDNPTGPVDNHEFSDADGYYNVTAEKVAFENVGVRFFNLPVTGSNQWSSDLYKQYVPSIAEALSYGPVLAHCRSGYRSSGYLAAYIAQQSGKCTHWAIKEARRIGFSFDYNSSDEDVIQFFQEILKC